MKKETTLPEALLILRDELRMVIVIGLIEALFIVTPRNHKHGSKLHHAINAWIRLCGPEAKKDVENFRSK